jgi:hypothetical protein
MAQPSGDWIARGTAIFSLIVSICAAGISYLNFSQQKHQFEVLQSEELLIQPNPRAAGPFRLTNVNFGEMGQVVQFPWKLLLTNSGNQKLSVVRYEITSGSTPDETFYTGIDGGIATADNTPVGFPFTLETGESRAFVVLVGIRVPPDVYNTLSVVDDPKEKTADQATIILARKGLDIYGNKVQFTETPGAGFALEIDPANQKSPRYWFKVVTGRGNAFAASASTYDRPR